MAIQSDGEVIISTKLDDTEFNQGVSSLTSSATKAGIAIAAAITAASVAVIALGSEFESANAKASTLFGTANVDMKQYSTDMLQISSDTAVAAKDLGNTMYDALSAGIPASDDMSEAMAFLEKNTKLAEAGFTDINTATTATAKVLNAYNMDVDETDRVHKILMQTQNKGITTVNELGSVLSQVTPTASAMNVSFEQVGAALASMTAQGTPTAQATTMLNGLLAELGKTGTQANDALMAATEGTEHAGKGFSDLMAEGVPLNEILDLMQTHASDNNLTLLDMFGSLEAGKAALSLAGKNSQQFTDNLEAMSTEIDVVDEAYDKVTDTFEFKSKKAVTSLQNVGIAAYDKFQEPLSDAMDTAQDALDDLMKSMNSGKLGKSVDTIAEGFGELITVSIEIAKKALPLVIDGFALLIDNADIIVPMLAAVKGGMLALKAVELAKSTLLPMVQGFQQAQVTLALYASTSGGATVATGALTGALTLKETLVALLTGKITLATAAQAAWNIALNANPIGLVVGAVAALTAGIVALTLLQGDARTEVEKLNDKMQEQADSFREVEEASKASGDAVMNDYARLESYKSELDGIIDANGKVVAGFEGRAEVLAGELADATGLEIELIDGQIQGYAELSDEIEKTLNKRKADALLSAYHEEYVEALELEKQALQDRRNAQQELDKAMEESAWIEHHLQTNRHATYETAKASYQAYYGSLQETLATADANYQNYAQNVIGYESAQRYALEGNVMMTQELLNQESSAYAENSQERANILATEIEDLRYANEQKAQMRTEANAQEIDSAINQANEMIAQKGLELYAVNNEIIANTPVYAEANKVLAEMGQSAFEDNGDLTPEARDKVIAAQKIVMSNEPLYAKALAELAESGQEVYDANGNLTEAAKVKISNAAAGVTQQETHINNAMKKVAESTKAEFDKMSLEASGRDTITGAITGMNSMKGGLMATAQALAQSVTDAYNKKLDIHSPSRVMKKSGINTVQGIEVGMLDEQTNLEKVVDGIADTTIGSLDNMLSNIDAGHIDSLMDKVNTAVQSNQISFEKDARVSAEYEVNKALLELQQKEVSVKGQIKAFIENHVNIDGRETAIALAPAIAQELEFIK